MPIHRIDTKEYLSLDLRCLFLTLYFAPDNNDKCTSISSVHLYSESSSDRSQFRDHPTNHHGPLCLKKTQCCERRASTVPGHPQMQGFTIMESQLGGGNQYTFGTSRVKRYYIFRWEGPIRLGGEGSSERKRYTKLKKNKSALYIKQKSFYLESLGVLKE